MIAARWKTSCIFARICVTIFRMKKREPRIQTSFRMSKTGYELLQTFARELGIGRGAMLEILVREHAREKEKREAAPPWGVDSGDKDRGDPRPARRKRTLQSHPARPEARRRPESHGEKA